MMPLKFEHQAQDLDVAPVAAAALRLRRARQPRARGRSRSLDDLALGAPSVWRQCQRTIVALGLLARLETDVAMAVRQILESMWSYSAKRI